MGIKGPLCRLGPSGCLVRSASVCRYGVGADSYLHVTPDALMVIEGAPTPGQRACLW